MRATIPRIRGPGLIAIALLAALISVIAAGPSAAVERVDTVRDRVTLSVSEGTVLRLDGNAASVFIADADLADVEVISPRLIYVFGRQPGRTDLVAVDANDRIVGSVTVVVTAERTELTEALGDIPGGQAVQVASIGQDLVLAGTLASATQAEEVVRAARALAPSPDNIINRLSVEGAQQVNLRVRIAEVTRDVAQALGINFSGSGGGDNSGLALSTNLVAASIGSGILGGASSILSAGIDLGPFDLDVLIDALEEESLVTVLSEPNLTAMSGETASFLAGGEFPVPVAQEGNTITIEFREFGVSLAFTPTVLGNGAISLHVRPEVSALSTTGAIQVGDFTVPALTTRRAETTVQVASGQSFAIAGLLQNSLAESVDQLPLLGDLPVLGPLFRSTRFANQETELVIIVTPYLVQPVAPRDVLAAAERLSDRRLTSALDEAMPDSPTAGFGGFFLK